MTKIKILYIITKADIGGAQKYAADLANNLDKNQFEAKILYGEKDLRWLSNKIWPWAFFLNDWLAIWELVKSYKKEQPHIIHLNSSKTGVLGSLAAFIYKRKEIREKRKVNVVFTAHGWVFNPTNNLLPPVRWFYILFHKFTALFQDKIICVSEYDRQLALKYKIVPGTKLITIHNGIDPNIPFLNKQAARKEILKKLPITNYQLPITNHWIGSIGRLVKEKNYETLIETAALIPNANFLIIGKGPEQKKLESRIKNCELSNRMFFIKPTGNDAQYLKAFDIFAMSSVKEGCPYILLEAMAAGLPAIVTETGGMPEMIKNQENGLVIPQKNPKALAEAIQKLLSNKTQNSEFGQIAKKTIQEKFELKKMAAQTTKVYKLLISN